jgi:peptidoglycan/xylan/chitin deacetylase (PgdA/CDA1 family)
MGVFLGCAPRWALRLYSDEYGEPLFYIETDRLVVALTIDDGPDPMTTPAILDVLARYRARATFFLISGNIPGNGALIRRLLAEGQRSGPYVGFALAAADPRLRCGRLPSNSDTARPWAKFTPLTRTSPR